MPFQVTVQRENEPVGFNPRDLTDAKAGDAVFWFNADKNTTHQMCPLALLKKEISMRLRIGAVLVFLLIVAAPPASAQSSRDATRDKLRELLETTGKRSDVNVEFHQSTKQPYNFVGAMKDGMTNVDSLEIVISVTTNDTIGFRVYPHYKGGYLNIKKVQDGPGLMHKLLTFSDRNFLFWGADSTDDVFCGYTFTMESGFPEQAIVVVLRSIRGTDKFAGELRPFIDGSAAVK
jgi:hypothetical protein